MYNAIFYDNSYYLLPKDFSDYAAFMHDLHQRTLPAQYSLVMLLEDHQIRNHTIIKGRSMAPYFLSGYHDESCTVTITSRDEVYPVHVDIMDQDEYNARLREVVNRVCPGCLRFKPLSNRVQSLNGHFEEISLDGTCVFRQESKPAPRSFHHHLFSFGGFFKRFHYAENDAARMIADIQSRFYARYADAVLEEENDRKILTLCCRKNELLTPILTEAISHYIDHISEGTYHIRLSDGFTCTEDDLKELLAEKNSERFRKECQKYGVSLAVLNYDAQASEQIRRSLKPLIDHFWLFPLLRTDGRDTYLVADTSWVLKELRYRAPLLQTYQTSVDVFDQYKNSHYEISFHMEHT